MPSADGTAGGDYDPETEPKFSEFVRSVEIRLDPASAPPPAADGAAAARRLDRVMSVSGLHDLRPLQGLAKNELWRLDGVESRAESPLLRTPRPGIDLVCVAGADERPEFIRQNAILPLVWQGLGANCHSQLLAGHNHFTIIETMTQPDSRLCELVDGPLA